MSDVDIELDELRLEESGITRDNVEAIRRSLEKIQLILIELNSRLEVLE